MHRRVRLDNLRGMDPVTLEVTITDVLRKPMGQIEPITLVDLLALATAELPASLRPAIRRFCDRIAREIADIPDGASWSAFLAEIDELPPERIPPWLREQLQLEAAREDRPPVSIERLQASLERWSAVAPEPFNLGTRGIKVARRAAAPPASSAPPKRRSRASSGPRASTSSRSRAPKQAEDPERQLLISQTVQERLAKYAAKGLAEFALLKSVPMQIASEQPGVTGAEVLAVLRDLEGKGIVRRTSGRWLLADRSYS
ncbi:MAG: hypothetical protein EA397_14250 [Deltaproteobacteria bacterium]|nr:MAG: hypothetical protein EA397_14250 [Deltaproteobacteria bacterium]